MPFQIFANDLDNLAEDMNPIDDLDSYVRRIVGTYGPRGGEQDPLVTFKHLSAQVRALSLRVAPPSFHSPLLRQAEHFSCARLCSKL